MECDGLPQDKCDEYWPPAGAGMEHGAFIIMGLEVVDRADYEIRTFEINQQGVSLFSTYQRNKLANVSLFFTYQKNKSAGCFH